MVSYFATEANPSRRLWKGYFTPFPASDSSPDFIAVTLSVPQAGSSLAAILSDDLSLNHPVWNTPQSLLILNGRDMTIRLANDVARENGAFVGLPITRLYPPPSAVIYDLLDEVRRTRQNASRLGMWRPKSLAGEIRLVRLMMSPVPRPDGSIDISCVVVNLSDVEMSKLGAVAGNVIADRARMQSVLEALPIGIEVLDTKSGASQRNLHYASMFGDGNALESERDIAYEDSGATIEAEDLPSAIATRTETTVTKNVHITRQDGSSLWTLMTSIPLRDQTGAVSGVVTTAVDVTSLRELQVQSLRQAEALFESNQELQHFAHVASHDLRQPLRAISGFMELLKLDYGDKVGERGLNYIEKAIGGTAKLQDVLDDLMTLYQVGVSKSRFERVSLTKPLKGALAQLDVEIRETKAKITADTLPTVMADEGQLLLLLQNLIENAMKFRGKDTPAVHISASKVENEWVVSVKDNGIGFDPKYATKIFDAFERLHTASEYAGTGIGLAICRKIVLNHGGRIWFESEPGKGSTFFFSLPEVGRSSRKGRS